MLGFTELLKNDDLPAAERKKYLDSVGVAGEALLQLLNDVLDLSKLESNQIKAHPTPLSLKQLGEEVINMFRISARNKKLTMNFQCSAPAQLFLDERMLRQVLWNLIGNAVKFTDKGHVELRANYLLEKDSNQTSGTLLLEVEDTGRGIPPEDIRKIDEPFAELSHSRGTASGHAGTGLGLAICRRMLERMNGTLEVESTVGKGSLFRIRLNRVTLLKKEEFPENQSSEKTMFPLRVTFSKHRVLLVDDVPMNLKMLQALLHSLGQESTAVESGSAALDLLTREKFDLVLSDLWMPEMNGEILARKVRAIPNLQNIPLFAVTADMDNESNFDMSIFNGTLTKPITRAKLQQLLIKIFAPQND